ncbi:MAG TPA: sigma-70 family RNA polymerase sigma factor [Caulifigura sp.]|nr:sigma-70 family RNA polymerase sigma factor [Caulifigura sp.]
MITPGKIRRAPESGCHRSIEFVRLWTAASPRVHAYLVTMVLNWADAEDLLQEVGVTVWMKFEEYDPGRDFVTWACGIARNKVLNYRQKASHRLVQSEELMAKIEQVSDSEPYSLDVQRDALRRCLERLNDSQRLLLSVAQSAADSLKSVAEDRGQSPQSLYKTVQRIRAKLFACVTRRLAEWAEA